eukprot:Hpha_TRINITY_DN15014_c2_g4::TRINITY_DN15014_c2_g4_i1::g.124397::m.124397
MLALLQLLGSLSVYELSVQRVQMDDCADIWLGISEYEYEVTLSELGGNFAGWTKVCNQDCQQFIVWNPLSFVTTSYLDDDREFCERHIPETATKIRIDFTSEEDQNQIMCDHYINPRDPGDVFNDDCVMSFSCEWDIPSLCYTGIFCDRSKEFVCEQTAGGSKKSRVTVRIKKLNSIEAAAAALLCGGCKDYPSRAPSAPPTGYQPTGVPLWIYVDKVEFEDCANDTVPATFGFSTSLRDDRMNEMCDPSQVCRGQNSPTKDLSKTADWGELCSHPSPGTRSVTAQFFAQRDTTGDPCDSPLDGASNTHDNSSCVHSGSCHFDIVHPITTTPQFFTCESTGNSTARIRIRIDTGPPPTLSPSLTPTSSPTIPPTKNPSSSPSLQPTKNPTAVPSVPPSGPPTSGPTKPPTANPMPPPSVPPSLGPSLGPSVVPSLPPSTPPSLPPSSE